MNRLAIYGGIVLLVGTFGAGFLLGRAGQHAPVPLSEGAMARLHERVAELRANVAAPVAKRRDAYAEAPKAAARGKALAKAAGVAPDVVVGFDLAAAPSAGTDDGVENAAASVAGDPCAPTDFRVSGNVQRLGATWVFDATLAHSWRGEVLWERPLRGPVRVWDASAEPERRWFAGPAVDVDGNFGGVVGREWRNFMVFGATTRDAAIAGIAFRW